MSTDFEHGGEHGLTFTEKMQVLKGYRHTPQAIKRLKELVKELESEAEKVTAAIESDGGHFVDTTKLQRCIERLEEAKMRLLAEEAELSDKRTKALEAIAALPEKERDVLFLIYIEGKPAHAAAYRLYYTERQIFRIKKRAIELLDL